MLSILEKTNQEHQRNQAQFVDVIKTNNGEVKVKTDIHGSEDEASRYTQVPECTDSQRESRPDIVPGDDKGVIIKDEGERLNLGTTDENLQETGIDFVQCEETEKIDSAGPAGNYSLTEKVESTTDPEDEDEKARKILENLDPATTCNEIAGPDRPTDKSEQDDTTLEDTKEIMYQLTLSQDERIELSIQSLQSREAMLR